MSPRARAAAVLLSILPWAAPAAASEFGFAGGARLEYRGALGALNVDEQAGRGGDGGSDLSGRGGLGLRLDLGIRLDDLELTAQAMIAIGGLDYERCRRFFAPGEDRFGTVINADVGGALRYPFRLGETFSLLAAGGAGWMRLRANYDVGSVEVDGPFIEAGGGARWKIARLGDAAARGLFLDLLATFRMARVSHVAAYLGTARLFYVYPGDPALFFLPGLSAGVTLLY